MRAKTISLIYPQRAILTALLPPDQHIPEGRLIFVLTTLLGYCILLRGVEEMPAFADTIGILSFTTQISGCIAARFEGGKKKKGGCATEIRCRNQREKEMGFLHAIELVCAGSTTCSAPHGFPVSSVTIHTGGATHGVRGYCPPISFLPRSQK